MRLFIAVNFDDEVKRKLLELQEQLRSHALKGIFTRPENFHLTLAFLGETPECRLADLFRIMEEMRAAPFDILFNHAGCFTHSRKELWWIGAAPDCPGLPLLKAVHKQLLGRLSDAGFSVDTRPFSPHITLGREVKHLNPIVLDCPELRARVERVSLMKSENTRGKLAYTELTH
jgi:2'-5' RNA ligase